MLNMGFLEDIEWIIDQLPENKQMVLFSATMPSEIKNIAKKSKQKKIDPKITNKIWNSMIKSFIDFEYRNFKKK